MPRDLFRMPVMIRIATASVVLASTALGLLTVFKIPDWLDWKWTVLACSFGYGFAVFPLGAAALNGVVNGWRSTFSAVLCAVALTAFCLLCQPCIAAWSIGRSLPARLARQFGPAEMPAGPFSFLGLFRPWPAHAAFTTWTYRDPLQLDFYPAAGRHNAPCVVVIHGGGWNDGDRGQVRQFNDWLASRGYAVADISYRLAPGAVWPEQRGDVAAALAFIRKQAKPWDIDASRLVLLGRSAGGQIAETCAYGLHDPSIRGVIGLYAPADMRFAWKWGRPDDALDSPKLLKDFLGGTPETAGAAYDSSSGLFLAGPKSPPTLLVHGTIDTLVWVLHSRNLHAKLTGDRVPNVLLELPWATHALEFNLSSPSGQLCTYATGWFLDCVCREPPVALSGPR